MGRKGRADFASLAADTSLAVLPPIEDPRSVALNEVARRPGNPRYGYDDPRTAEVADSIREDGQKQAASVMPADDYLRLFPEHVGKVGPARWVLVDGHRRHAAAVIAGKTLLQITVDTTLTSRAAVVKAALTANVHREDVPPLLEARELQTLLEEYGSQRAVAAAMHKSQGWVSQRIALLRLAPSLQKDLSRGRITVEEARVVAKAPAGEQHAQLDEFRAARRSNGEVEQTADPTGDAAEVLRRNQPTKPKPDARLEPGRAPALRVRTSDLKDAAEDLCAHFKPDQLAELVKLLQKAL